MAAPILVFGYGGLVGHGNENLVISWQSALRHLAPAVWSVNLISSLADRLLSGFMALAALEFVRPGALAPLSTADHQHAQRISTARPPTTKLVVVP